MSIVFGTPSVTPIISGASNATITGSAPSGITPGTVMIALLANNSGNVATPSGTLTLPADWSLVSSNFPTDGRWTCHAGIAKKIYTGTESFEFGITASTNDDMLVILPVTGVNFDSITTSASWTDGNSTAPVCPAVTTPVDGATIACVAVQKNGWPDALAATPPGGMTLVYNGRTRDLSPAARISLATQIIATAGATGTRTWASYSAANYYGGGITFMMQDAAPSGPAVNPTGTDVVLVEGSSYEIQLDNMTGVAATAVAIRYTLDDLIITETQADFVYTPTDDTGVIAFTATRGDLPYGATGFEYVITLDEGDPIVYAMTSFSPAAGDDVIVAVDPVGDNTGFLYQFSSGSVSNPDQIKWTIAQAGGTLEILPDTTFRMTSAEFPETAVLYGDYWNSTTGEWYVGIAVHARFSASGGGSVVDAIAFEPRMDVITMTHITMDIPRLTA